MVFGVWLCAHAGAHAGTQTVQGQIQDTYIGHSLTWRDTCVETYRIFGYPSTVRSRCLHLFPRWLLSMAVQTNILFSTRPNAGRTCKKNVSGCTGCRCVSPWVSSQSLLAVLSSSIIRVPSRYCWCQVLRSAAASSRASGLILHFFKAGLNEGLLLPSSRAINHDVVGHITPC